MNALLAQRVEKARHWLVGWAYTLTTYFEVEPNTRPGRLWMLRGGAPPSTQSFATVPPVFQAASLLGIGPGLQTLARPWMVRRVSGAHEAGYWNGQLACIQGFARALDPLLVVTLATVSSAPVVLVGLGAALRLLTPGRRRRVARSHRTAYEEP